MLEMTACSHMVCVSWCPIAKPTNTASMMMMSLMLVFVVFVIVLVSLSFVPECL